MGSEMCIRDSIYGTGQGWPLSTTHCQIGATVAVGLFPVWKSTSIATPSKRRRVDGVDVDAKIQRERAINFDFHTGCLKAVRASTPGSSPSAASAGSSRSSSSARRPRSSSGPRPSRSRASTATTTARSTPASGCSEQTSFPARPGHQGIDRTRPGHQGRPAARARLRMYKASSLYYRVDGVRLFLRSLGRDLYPRALFR